MIPLEKRGLALSNQLDRVSTIWPTERLFFDGDEYFNAIDEKISTAQHEIFVESYIFDVDALGKKLLSSLQTAAQRGVTVRLLVDGIGSYNWLGALRTECRRRQIQFRIYHPLPFSLSLRKISWQRIRRFLALFRRMNRRNHRKVVVIDRSQAFLGSYNISHVHSRKIMAEKVWRDSGIYVEGPSVRRLHRAFMTAWSKSRFQFFRSKSKEPRRGRRSDLRSGLIRLNSKLRWRISLLRDLQLRLRSAQQRVLVTNAYFLPRQGVLRSLRKAARRGVFVGLCIPAKSDIWFLKIATKFLYYRLLKDGIRIFEYQPTILHAKTLVIDDWATVGSHNLNHRSLVHDLEVEAVVTHAENIQKLVSQWDLDVAQSKAIHLQDLGRIRWWTRLMSRFFYWFRYWI